MEIKGFFQFEIIIDVLVSSFRFIRIPLLWVYDQYKYFTLTVRGSTLESESDVYRCHILTSKVDSRVN